ncbi:hypothetical protein [Pseudomonas sp. PL-6]
MTESTNFDPNALEVLQGNHRILLASWRFPRDGNFAPLWNAANSSRGTLSLLLKKLDAIKADARLSEVAQSEDSKAAAVAALEDLGQSQRALLSAVNRFNAEFMKLASVTPYGGATAAADAVIDCEIARHFRTLTGDDRGKFISRMISGEYEREIDAALRLPASLFGLNEETRIAVGNSALQRKNPGAVDEFRELSEGANLAQFIMRRVYDRIVGASALTIQERMQALGKDAWQPYVKEGSDKVMNAMAERYGVA